MKCKLFKLSYHMKCIPRILELNVKKFFFSPLQLSIKENSTSTFCVKQLTIAISKDVMFERKTNTISLLDIRKNGPIIYHRLNHNNRNNARPHENPYP